MPAANCSDRNYFFDNAKFILILLVVIGHAIQIIANNHVIFFIYKFIYLFHMPAFIFIAGYFTKFQQEQKFSKLLILYVIFQTLYCIGNIFAAKNADAQMEFFEPCWVMWFLVSIISLKLILPYITKFRHPIIISLVIAVLAGYEPLIGSYLSLSRTIVFMPFFLLGYYCNDQHLKKIKNIPPRTALGIVLLSALILFMLAPFDLGFLFNDRGYEMMDINHWYAGFFRLAFLLWSMILTICFLALVPEKQKWFSDFGKRTMQVYLTHGFVLGGLVGLGLTNAVTEPPHIIVFFMLVTMLTILLSTQPITYILAPLLNPFQFASNLKSCLVSLFLRLYQITKRYTANYFTVN